jgi:hypothetical protein
MSESVKLPEPAAWMDSGTNRCSRKFRPDWVTANALYTADQLTAAHAAGVRAGMLRAAQMVPTSWLDSLLTGKEAVVGTPPFGCPDIERLLSAIAAAIRSEAEREGEK